MDMRKIVTVAVAAMALAAIAMWLRPSESKRIRKVFTAVSKEIHKDGQEGLVVSTAKAHALAELVARQARFKIDEEVLRGVSGGRQLVQQIVLVRGQADKIDVDFADIAIAFDVAESIWFSAPSIASNEPLTSTHSVRFTAEFSLSPSSLLRRNILSLFVASRFVSILPCSADQRPAACEPRFFERRDAKRFSVLVTSGVGWTNTCFARFLRKSSGTRSSLGACSCGPS